jgi:hypothetical protein
MRCSRGQTNASREGVIAARRGMFDSATQHVPPIRRKRASVASRYAVMSAPPALASRLDRGGGCDVVMQVLPQYGSVIRVFGAGRRNRRLSRVVLIGAVRLLLALAVVCGTVQAGAHYFYCEGVGFSASDPCAARAREGDRCPLNSAERQSIDCCAVISLPSMPDAAREHEHTVQPAGVVAVMPAGQYASTRPEVGEKGFARRAERWCRPPRSPGELRVQLMVFLT